jgi:hypothetical protein
MDPCASNIEINNARTMIRTQLGVPKSYAKNFTRKQVCDAFRRCKDARSFPPMVIDVFDGYIYMIDPDSPIGAKEYKIIFEKGTKAEVVSVAKKLGLVELDVTKIELVANIVKLLESLNIKEPIKAMKLPTVSAKNKNFNFNGNRPTLGSLGNLGNAGNRPTFGSLGNAGNRPTLGSLGNLGNADNRPTLGNLGNAGNRGNALGLPNANRKRMPNAVNMKTQPFTRNSEGTPGFTPGKPKPKGMLPSGINSSGTKISFGGVSTTGSINKKSILKRLNKIKEDIGVFSANNGQPKPQPQPQARPQMMAPRSTTGSAGTVQHFYMGGAPQVPAFGSQVSLPPQSSIGSAV